ncbi:E3 ubiquitin-protein ligase SHPRH [Armadillidium nasatum]|uniref:E3 ubiquitin-protein ligase SHPRH n=1 Tax=Armadillidium nasatum TaxID=96803 RepID=A0A5N5TP27_9CRUS|nr:E3 ubiquitin-protein ligase SHPRH [Armadillidium nasatum]
MFSFTYLLKRRFRYAKRFMTTPSPLPCIEWWRVCLDEAQMVEGTNSKTAEMALRLTAVNRWCITGTPIQKMVNDLQGLLMFLGVDPYYDHHWWNRCLYVPYCHEEKEPLHNVIAKYMWRNSKLDVINELDVPPQTEELHWLDFTPVEDHFYRRLHNDCSDEALKKIQKFPNRTIKLNSLDRKTLSSLLQPLLKLRQACNHPQVVKGHFTGLNRQTLTMEELLDNLLKKTQIEAEDAQRIIVASLNGLAALDIIRGNYGEAVSKYREVLRSVEEHKKNIKTDSLQQLHTLHNLSEIIQGNHEGIHPTLRDGSLKEEAKAIRDKHLKIYPQRIAEAELECRQSTLSIEDQKKKYNSKIEWWITALETLDREFVQEVREQLLAQYSRFEEDKCILYSVSNKVQMMHLLRAKFKVLNNQRKCMINFVRELLDVDPDSILNGAIDCHLRPFDTNRELCVLCRKHEIFEDYEKTIFFVKEKSTIRSTERAQETMEMKNQIQLFESTRQGNWGQSEIEKVLRFLQTKTLGSVYPEVHEDSQTHLSILQVMKKEFKNYRILWRAIYDQVSALDEVNMATMRYRLRLPGEELLTVKKDKNEKLSNELKEKFDAPKHILEEVELDQQELKLKSDKIVSQSDLRVKLGQYFYLSNLKNTDFGKDGGSNPEPCPVCQGTLGVKWKVLLCGHSFCMDCISLLVKKVYNNKGSLRCPICRQPTRIREIAYVDMMSKEREEEVKVSGSLSTKIEGVVRVMLKIKSSDPEAKVLLFSTWNEVLEVIADGFSQNGITHRILQNRTKFQETLSSFKSKQEITALLMPLSSGGNGLNLVEARHVILVEPILNPAAEFQAIGRVHRIGQNKQTVVHRFIIRDTIEERMHKLLQPKYGENSGDDNNVTIEDLYQLFSRENIDGDTSTDGNRGENDDIE